MKGFSFFLCLHTIYSQSISFYYNASNANSLQERRVISSLVDSPWLKVLGFATDLAACGTLCVEYTAARCTGFTRTATPNGTRPNCFGNVDGAWLPLPDSPGPHLFDCGRVSWPCESALDCSLNGQCQAGSCACSSGWVGERCGTLDLLPVDPAVWGFNPVQGGHNMSSWGGSVQLVNGTAHMWASRLDNHCGIDSYLLNSRVVHAVAPSPVGPYTDA